MNEENKVGYYAIIPATVRYDKQLKFAERLLYGELTALANANGYCYAQNKYFANLYEVTNGTVSKWISHLQQLGYIEIKILRNEKKEIVARHIYIMDLTYGSKKIYPYDLKNRYPIVQNDIDNNTDKKIDDLFNLIINDKSKIENEFYLQLERLEFIYTDEILCLMNFDKVYMLKEIIYILYSLFSSGFKYLISKIDREYLLNLYILAKEHNPDDFINYYKRSLLNKYTNNKT